MVNTENEKEPISPENLVPVSLLCGFLGAGKTTMMKHILETKHAEEGFKCAVIVNDMAALNIDKSLIDQSALVQSDEVIAMQNGCFCCTLQSDLVDQIISLCEKKIFNYILIEASGVSEPSQIAPLFDLCDDEHDPEDPEADHNHDGKPQLGEVARLDTCVTVVDSAEFYNNLESMNTYEQGETVGTIAELMMEQVEFSNVVVLNKGDLVSEDQQEDIITKVKLIQPNAKIIKSVQSRVDVLEILNTKLYKADQNKDEFWIAASKVAAEEKIEAEFLECCEKSLVKDGKKCCKSQSKDGKLVDSGLSQVQLEVIANVSDQEKKITRHEKRFGITSFIYKSRRPFHPGRLGDLFLEPFFAETKMDLYEEEEDEEEEETEDQESGNKEGKKPKKTEEEIKKEEEEKEKKLKELQKEAAKKQKIRTGKMGELLRSKGFIWIATSHDVIGGWQQAGNIIRLEAESPWMCEIREMWEGSPSEELVLKDILQANGEEYKYADRRQELVFIGQSLKHEVIQKILDMCLLTDEEMELGPEKWKETMADVDNIKLALDEDEDEESEGEEEEDEDGEENEREEEKEVTEAPIKKRKNQAEPVNNKKFKTEAYLAKKKQK